MKQIIINTALFLLIIPTVTFAQTDAPSEPPTFNYTIVNETTPEPTDTGAALDTTDQGNETNQDAQTHVPYVQMMLVAIGWLIVIGLFAFAAFLIIQKSAKIRKKR